MTKAHWTTPSSKKSMNWYAIVPVGIGLYTHWRTSPTWHYKHRLFSASKVALPTNTRHQQILKEWDSNSKNIKIHVIGLDCLQLWSRSKNVCNNSLPSPVVTVSNNSGHYAIAVQCLGRHQICRLIQIFVVIIAWTVVAKPLFVCCCCHQRV